MDNRPAKDYTPCPSKRLDFRTKRQWQLKAKAFRKKLKTGFGTPKARVWDKTLYYLLGAIYCCEKGYRKEAGKYFKLDTENWVFYLCDENTPECSDTILAPSAIIEIWEDLDRDWVRFFDNFDKTIDYPLTKHPIKR